MKKVTALLVAGSTFAIAAPAMAQDTSAFTGPRVEAVIGYDIAKAGSDIDNDQNDNDDQDVDGFMYGAAIGYDVAVGSLVIGADAELTDSTAKVERDRTGDIEAFGLGRVEAGRDLYLGARIGGLVSDRTLLYAKGGYTNARFEFTGTDGEINENRRIDTDGYRIGAGVEHAVNENTFVKLEYRYSNYSEGEIDFEDENVGDSGRFDIDTDRHQIVAGVGLRF